MRQILLAHTTMQLASYLPYEPELWLSLRFALLKSLP
jgi:hypothetical protein